MKSVREQLFEGLKKQPELTEAHDVEGIIEALELAGEHVDRAADAMIDAMGMIRRSRSKLGLNYDMEGNMRAYVLNYLTEGVDSISEKIEKYVNDLQATDPELGEPDEEPAEEPKEPV